MELCEKLKEEYLNEVTALINQYKENSIRLIKDGSRDEGILENIKSNVAEIFYKMFNISYNNTCKNTEDQKIKLNNLSKAYLAFFDKIPAPWKEKMTKDKEHNMMEEYYIEEIKLDTAEKVKRLFIEYHSKYYKEN